MTACHPEQLSARNLADGARLRCDLLAAGYTVDGVHDLLGAQASAALRRDQFAAARHHLDRAGDTALATLVRLFLLGEDLPAAQLSASVPKCGVDAMARLGLVHCHGERVRAALDLRPHCEDGGPPWWLVSDLGAPLSGQPLGTGYVLGIGQASRTLAAATPRPVIRRALDLGVGCGVQAVRLSRHCDQVVATDLSARALRLAQLSFVLSDVRVECRRGDLLTPVRGEHFDLIVSNPPFVITPRDAAMPTFTYRDGGRTGDDLVRSLVTEVGMQLAPAGLFVALGNWEVHGSQEGRGRGQGLNEREGHGQEQGQADTPPPAPGASTAGAPEAGSDWRRRLTDWLDDACDEQGNPLDAWVIQRELLDPAEYAGLWSRDSGAPGPERERLVGLWLDDFAARGVTAIGLGLILLRRPGPATRAFRRLEHRTEALPDDLGSHLLGCLTAHDRLADPITEARLRVVDGVVEEREHRPGQADPTAIRLRQRDGFGRSVRLDTPTAAFVGACDGELTVGQLAAAIAGLLDLPADETLAGLSAAARDLVLDGFLRP